MSEILFQYQRVNPTTWVYLSSLLMIGIYFKFSRLWSVRNLDLLCLIMLSPGLLLVLNGQAAKESWQANSQTIEVSENSDSGTDAEASEATPKTPVSTPFELSPTRIQHMGFVCLFFAGGILLVRLLIDPAMVRRPLLEPNLSIGGMTFLGVSLFVFLMANVLTGKVTPDDLAGSRQAELLQAGRSLGMAEDQGLNRYGPGYPLLFLLPKISTGELLADQSLPEWENLEIIYMATARSMAILSHLAIVMGIVLIGHRHFNNLHTGIATATLYLMLPYTAQMTGRVSHVLPAALLTWAVLSYRQPLFSGMLMGLVTGVIYYPIFLLPLWISFYWHRGLGRFLLGVSSTTMVLVGVLAFTATDFSQFMGDLKQMFGWRLPVLEDVQGFWMPEFNDSVFRIPVLAGFLVMSVGFCFWPPQKNLGTLMSCSAAVMLGTQFWHAHGGGLFVAWYLPLLLLTVFRPNLEDRVALRVLGLGWLDRPQSRLTGQELAA